MAKDGKEYDWRFVEFNEPVEIFLAFQNKAPQFINRDKNKLTYALLHQDWGLCVYIIYVKSLNKKFIVLRQGSYGIKVFLHVVCSDKAVTEGRVVENTSFDREKVQEILNRVDTEWDRKVARVSLSSNRSRSQIHDLGTDYDNVKTDVKTVHLAYY